MATSAEGRKTPAPRPASVTRVTRVTRVPIAAESPVEQRALVADAPARRMPDTPSMYG